MYIASCFGALRYVGIFIEVSFCIGVVLNHMPIGPTKPKQLDKIAFKAGSIAATIAKEIFCCKKSWIKYTYATYEIISE